MPHKKTVESSCPKCEAENSHTVEILKNSETETSIVNVLCLKCPTEYKFEIKGKPHHNSVLIRATNNLL